MNMQEAIQKAAAEKSSFLAATSCCLTNDWITAVIQSEADKFLIDGQAFIYRSSISAITVKGKAGHIKAALSGLFNNAFHVSAKDTLVACTVFEKDGKCIIQIKHTCDKRSTGKHNKKMSIGGYTFQLKGDSGAGIEMANLCITQFGGTVNIHKERAGEYLETTATEVVLPAFS